MSIVESTEMRKGEPRNSPSTLFAMNDTTNHIIADPTILMQGNAMKDENIEEQNRFQYSHEKEKPEFLGSGHSDSSATNECGSFIIAENPIYYKDSAMSHLDHDDSHHYGHYTVSRKLMNHGSYRSAPMKYQKVLSKILEKAAYAPTTHHIGPVEIQIQPGQYCVTHRKLADLCNEGVTIKDDLIGKTTIPRALAYFEKCHFLGQEVVQGKTLITLTLSRFYEHLNQYGGATFGPQAGQGRGSKQESKERKEETTSKEEGVDAAAAFFSESYDFLVQFGVAKKTAKELATHPLAFIKEKHSLVMARKNISNPVGWLINAIERDYSVAKAECPASVKAFRKRLVLDLQERELIVKVISDKLRFNDHVVDLNQSISDIIDHVNKSLINNKLNKNDYANY